MLPLSKELEVAAGSDKMQVALCERRFQPPPEPGKPLETFMLPSDDIVLDVFYAYGHEGQDMLAVRAPFSMGPKAQEIIGRRVRAGDVYYRVVSVKRQIYGVITVGEPIGIEVCRDG